ncbi:uncharacterized protein LOC125501955 [Athalia rosae]|uniref:uncharacterized protein LOC125501955 n=1 Tax=Athalia rosae TaxID=37344 RepID=UPI0020343E7C|nr:uncharacterized protein LOC125501955 [Athalia rosae]
MPIKQINSRWYSVRRWSRNEYWVQRRKDARRRVAEDAQVADINVHPAADVQIRDERQYTLDKDEGASQNVRIHAALDDMGLRNDSETLPPCDTKLSTEELIAVLESENDDNEAFPNLLVERTENIDQNSIDRVTKSLQGRQIVDFAYMFWDLLIKFENHCRGVQCCFRDLAMTGSQRFGLEKKFIFTCRMCNYEDHVWSEAQDEACMDVNRSAVAGTIAIRTGFRQLQEQLAAMNISYIKLPRQLIGGICKSNCQRNKTCGQRGKTVGRGKERRR